MDYDKIIDSLSLDDLVGQLLCYNISPKKSKEETEEIIKSIKPGSLFLTNMDKEEIAFYTNLVNKYTKIPVIIASDVENGPEIAIKNSGKLPHPMAWGACDDESLIYKASELSAKICRKNGVHWTFAPVVDVNYNFQNTAGNIRCISDKPEQVIKMASSFVDGIQSNDYMAATAKHFPGNGIDERNAHFVTTINPMSKEEWLSSYGKIYSTMIQKGVKSIMIGHDALPAFENAEDIDPILGPPPAVLSYNLMTKLLKETLGFDGVVVSDAMSMIGVASRVNSLDELAVKFINAGGDVVLFPEPNDFNNIKNAVINGDISKERLKDAVKRVLVLKNSLKMFDSQEEILKELDEDFSIADVGQKIADKSIKVVRDIDNVIPITTKNTNKILFVNIVEPHYHVAPNEYVFDALKNEFEKNGYIVDQLFNTNHYKIKEVMDDYDFIMVNCNFSPQTYHGSTLRVGWNNIHAFWRGYILQHPKLIFTSFGDPYKLYDFPYLKTYINAFSDSQMSQIAVAKIVLGQISPTAKNPVSFKNYFNIEV